VAEVYYYWLNFFLAENRSSLLNGDRQHNIDHTVYCPVPFVVGFRYRDQ
jgi:hypothetical protein